MLEKVSGSRAASSMEPTIKSLEGDGYSQMGKMADAGKQYEAAAAASGFEVEKGFYQSKAARAYQAAGDTAKARKIWTDLTTNVNASMMTEAKVRLGELTAQPAKK